MGYREQENTSLDSHGSSFEGMLVPADIVSIFRGIMSAVFAYPAVFGPGMALCQQPESVLAVEAQSGLVLSRSGDVSLGAPQFHVTSDLVVIPVTVTDHQGRTVRGLQKEHFTLYEDSVEQRITQFASEDVPVSISLVLDTSASMGPKLERAREAAAALVNNSNPEDEFSLVKFNSRAELTMGFTKNKKDIRSRMAMVQTSGATALLDAVAVALNEMKGAHHTRKAIILISDGEDNASHCSVQELKEAVRRADVLIYVIGISDSYSRYRTAQSLAGFPLLEEITQQTGGHLFQVNRLKQLTEIASKIGAWLRNQYVLAYAPNNLQNNGTYHEIKVTVSFRCQQRPSCE
jgi:VWFA-related protein